MMFLLGPVTTALCEKFGCRVIAVTGGLFCMVGMVASAYAPTLKIMYLSFGMTWGLGTSFCYFPTLIILVPYFNKRLALVNGIVSAGSGVGTLALSPFIKWFAKLYGAKNMFYMLGALHGLVFLAGFMYRPINAIYRERQDQKNRDLEAACEEEQKLEELEKQCYNQVIVGDSGTIVYQDKQKIIDCFPTGKKTRLKKLRKSALLSLFKDKAFIAWCFGLSVFILGYFVPFVHIVSSSFTSGLFFLVPSYGLGSGKKYQLFYFLSGFESDNWRCIV